MEKVRTIRVQPYEIEDEARRDGRDCIRCRINLGRGINGGIELFNLLVGSQVATAASAVARRRDEVDAVPYHLYLLLLI